MTKQDKSVKEPHRYKIHGGRYMDLSPTLRKRLEANRTQTRATQQEKEATW